MKRILLVLFCLSLPLLAQEKPAQVPPTPGGPKATPSPEMQKLLKTFRGVWDATEKHEPSPIVPSGGTGKGQAHFMAGPGGLSLIENYTSEGGSGRFVGHSVIWWDADKHAYIGIWCDNTLPSGCEPGATMTWEDNNKLTGTAETSMMGQKAKLTETYSNITPNSFTFTVDMNIEDTVTKRLMTIEFTRVGAAPVEKK